MNYLTTALRDFRELRLLAFLALSALLMRPAYGQVAGATLSGTVTDSSGAIVPQAQVSIKNLGTGISTAVTVNSDGFYTAPNLLPGTYAISASAPGFGTEVQTGITLTVGEQQVLNFTLKVGHVAEKVEVVSTAPVVELASSAIGGVVNSNTVVELPLNGRDWTSLATLEPGVQALQTQIGTGATTTRGNRGVGNEVTISGSRPQSNNYRLNGISIVDYANGSPGSVNGFTLGVDAIAEFSVVTSNYSAEYGRTSGGVINAITRSGSNQIHGDAYWFLRDEALDARNFFDTTLPLFNRNQNGAAAGGPIQKDKTFFFADYEGFRQNLASTTLANVPSPDARNGVLHNADGTTCTIGVPSAGCAEQGNPMNSAGTVGVDPLVKPYLTFYPLPNAGLLGTGDTGIFKTANSATTDEDFETVRIDRKFSEKDSLMGSWFFDKGSAVTPDGLNDGIFGNASIGQMVGLEETHIFSPTLVNSVRGGYHRAVVHGGEVTQAVNPAITEVSLGTFPGLPTPQLSVPGLADFTSAGVGPYTGDLYVWNSFQAYDDAFLTKGFHAIKFGFAFEQMETDHDLV